MRKDMQSDINSDEKFVILFGGKERDDPYVTGQIPYATETHSGDDTGSSVHTIQLYPGRDSGSYRQPRTALSEELLITIPSKSA